MIVFDRVQWERRARTRHKRLQNNVLYGRDLFAISALARVVKWCNDRQVVIRFDRVRVGGTYERSTITINRGSTPEQQLFLALHECGHHLIAIGKEKRHGSTQSTLTNRLNELEEEFEAWNRGRRLAKRLGISVNDRRLTRQRSRWLRTYVNWTARAR